MVTRRCSESGESSLVQSASTSPVLAHVAGKSRDARQPDERPLDKPVLFPPSASFSSSSSLVFVSVGRVRKDGAVCGLHGSLGLAVRVVAITSHTSSHPSPGINMYRAARPALNTSSTRSLSTTTLQVRCLQHVYYTAPIPSRAPGFYLPAMSYVAFSLARGPSGVGQIPRHRHQQRLNRSHQKLRSK